MYKSCLNPPESQSHMKFEKFLNKGAVPEWRPKYLNYHLLKDHLKNIPMNQEDQDIEAEFFLDMKKEVKKISQFYGEKEREIMTKWTVFGQVMSKRDLINFYTEIDLFKSFQSLNVTAVKKILKKFVKVTGKSEKAADFLLYEAESCPFWNSSKVLDDLSDRIEELFTSKYSGGDRHRAMRRLRLRNFRSESFHASALVAGSLWSLSIAGIAYIVRMNTHKLDHLYILASLFLPFMALGLFSLNEYVFKSSYVNYRFVFQFDKRTALHECQYFALTGSLAFTFVLTSIFVLSRVNESTRLLLLPLIITSILFLNPFPWPWLQSRLWMIKTLFRILTAPFHQVMFKDFFINDHLISLGIFFQGILRCCGVDSSNVSVKLVPIAPYIPRILQCVRRYYDTKKSLNLLNALKYTLVVLVIILRSFVPLQTVLLNIFQCSSTFFSLYWDTVMDFGFLQTDSKNLFLRNELVVFPNKIVYYYMILFNLAARFTWTIPVYSLFTKDSELISLALAVIEILRRFHWSFLRTEYEHLNNCNSFRAVEELKVRNDDLFYKDMVYESRDQIEGIVQDVDSDTKGDYEYTELIDSV